MVDVTVSIINHNSIETLFECLEAVEINLRQIENEVYLVDNLCERKAGEEARIRFPTIRVIDNNVRMGFAANHNMVIGETNSDYILVLNPDVILPPDAVSMMYSFMENNPFAAVCGPALIDESGNLQPLVKQLIKPVKETILLACYISDINPYNLIKIKPHFRKRAKGADIPLADPTIEEIVTVEESPHAQSVEWISGACMFFRRSALREIGLFDERFFLYFEETDWCLRAKNRGNQIYYLPWITAVHIGGTSTRASYLDNLTIYVKSAVKYYEKHMGARVSNFLKIGVRTVAAINILRWSILSKIRSENCQRLRPWIGFSKKIAFESF